MDQTFLLKLVADLIKTDKPTVEEIRCARTIITNLIEGSQKVIMYTPLDQRSSDVELDSDALDAKRELIE